MITTYDSNCGPCLSGMIHPYHEPSGAPTMAETSVAFDELPPEHEVVVGRGRVTKARCGNCGCHR